MAFGIVNCSSVMPLSFWISLVPVGLGYGELYREDHGLLLRDLGDRSDRLPVVGDRWI